MKLILHIGTNKTGTTAVQQFLDANRNQLWRRGFHYATPHRERDSNKLADAVRTGDASFVRAFFAKQLGVARQRGAHTLLVSAEKFYAMSVRSSMRQREICTNAVERDSALIQQLQSLIPEGMARTEIVCYFRRPDRYAESLYCQHVTTGIVFHGFQEFLPIVESALHYNSYMNLWTNIFGEENCSVRIYERAAGDIVGDFLANVLHIHDLVNFTKSDLKANERVSRDLLEFKRIVNASLRLPERDIERTILRLVAKEMRAQGIEPRHYQDFLSPDRRAELLTRLQWEIEGLRTSYGVPAFPSFDAQDAKMSWKPYPGLDRDRRAEIEVCYARVRRRAGFRLERLALRSAGRLRRAAPGTAIVLDALKEMGGKRALHEMLARLHRETA
jgi:hypothetical protein